MPNGLQRKPAASRKPNATGVVIDSWPRFDESRVSENVLDSGTYDLFISAKGFQPTRKTVVVYAAQVTAVEVTLERAP